MTETGQDSQLADQERVFLVAWNEIRQQGTQTNFRLAHEQGMSATQFTLLGIIERSQGTDGCTVGGLARQMELDPATVVRALDIVERRGLVARRRSAQDRRLVQVELTEEGRKLQREVQQRYMAKLSAQFRGMSASGREALLQSLEEFLALGRQRESDL